MNNGLVKNYIAGATIAPYRILKVGAADGAVLQSAASTDIAFGVSGILGASTGEDIDVIHSGIVDVLFGGTVARGEWVTADANGKAVAAAPGAGVNARVIGYAIHSHVDGDIGRIFMAPGTLQG